MEIKFGCHSCYLSFATSLHITQEPGLSLLYCTFSACVTEHRDHITPKYSSMPAHTHFHPLYCNFALQPFCSGTGQHQGGLSAHSQSSLFEWIGLLVQALPQDRSVWENLTTSWILLMNALSIFPSIHWKSVFKNTCWQGQCMMCLSAHRTLDMEARKSPGGVRTCQFSC